MSFDFVRTCVSVLSAFMLTAAAHGAAPTPAGSEAGATRNGSSFLPEQDLLKDSPLPDRNWYVQASVAAISKKDIGAVLSGGLDPASGDGAGEVYSLMVNRVVHRLEIPFRDGALRPQFELYGRLTLVDENGGSVFPDYNAGFGFRWVDFPWDRWVDTSFFMGLGLSYSSRVYAMDRLRHPDEDRSHVKLDWPIQLTLALPRWPEHQVVLFVDHQSGGHIFDRGGVNAVGVGYQFQF